MARNTDTASAAQKRIVVSISESDGAALDKIGADLAKAVQNATGVAVELSRAQVVSSLVKSYGNAQGNGAA